MTKMNKKVFGVMGIGVYMANPNADFTMYPREVNGQFVMSPMSLKYPIRRYWDIDGETVLIYKSMKIDKGVLRYRELSERYQDLLGVADVSKQPRHEVYENLFKCVDVVNFGVALAVPSNSISIEGAVQFQDAVNLFEDAEVVEYQILSPFVNPNSNKGTDKKKPKTADAEGIEDENSGAKQTTLGSRKVVSEGHYFSSIRINPFNYKNIYDVPEMSELCYTVEAYEKLKNAMMVAYNDMNTMSKAGLENEFLLLIEMKDSSKISLPSLHNYISFSKEDGVGIINLEKLEALLLSVEEAIDKVEVYYNPVALKIVGLDKLSHSKFNILSKSKI